MLPITMPITPLFDKEECVDDIGIGLLEVCAGWFDDDKAVPSVPDGRTALLVEERGFCEEVDCANWECVDGRDCVGDKDCDPDGVDGAGAGADEVEVSDVER